MRDMRARVIATVGLVAAFAVIAGCGAAHDDRAPTVTTALAGGDPGTPPAPGLHATTPSAPRAPKRYASFRMPSGRYACTVLDATLVCDFRLQSGDRGYPTPNVAMTKTCRREASGEWGNGVSLAAHGAATPNCSTGVNVTDASPPKLAYGERWARASFTCHSATTGLTCSTKSGHGFFADKDTIRVH